MSRIFVDARTLRAAPLRPPVSKSDAQRALVVAEITGLPPPAVGLAPPADVAALASGLEILRMGSGEPIQCGDGAAPLRLLLAQAAVKPGTHRLAGSRRLSERSHLPLRDALLEALGKAGLRISSGTPWPWVVEGTLGPGSRSFDAPAGSSQFATALLLAAAARAFEEAQPWRVSLAVGGTSAGYPELTLNWLRRAGFGVEHSPGAVVLRRGPLPESLGELPTDWSSAGYLLPIAWRSGGEVLKLDWDSAQPDRAIVRLLAESGLTVERSAAGGARVHGRAVRGVRASARECPDLIPTLAALACALPAPSRFSEVELLRDKESDRVAGILDLVDRVGGSASLRGSTLEVRPPRSPPSWFGISSRGDHRLAMAAATAAVVLGLQVDIEGAEHVGKSFPGFFEELSRSGAIVC